MYGGGGGDDDDDDDDDDGGIGLRAFHLLPLPLDPFGQVDDDTSILDAGLDAGVELPHDCKMGVCMTCPARLVSGELDQTQGMLDEEAQEKGFALMCVSYARGDVKIDLIDEDSLVDEMMIGHQ